MAEGKYAKQVMELTPPNYRRVPQSIGKYSNSFDFSSKDWYRDSRIWVQCNIIYAPGGYFGAGETVEITLPDGNKKTVTHNVHRHPVDEAFFFIGTNPHDSTDLGGEYEFWIGEGKDAEKYLFTKTTCIYVPAGLAHNPNFARRVDRPFLMIVVLCAGDFSDEHVDVFPPGFKPLPGFKPV